MDVIFSKMKKLGKLGICAIAVVVLLVILLAIFSPKGGTAYNVKTSLSEIVQTADMFTAEYTYNSVVGVKIDPNADNTENNIKYYVSYKGSVKSGFDFKKIEVRENGDNIIIHLPEVTIREINVDREEEKEIINKLLLKEYGKYHIIPSGFDYNTGLGKANGKIPLQAHTTNYIQAFKYYHFRIGKPKRIIIVKVGR